MLKNRYVIFVMAVIIVAIFVHIFFWKGSKLELITNVFERSFDDTITYVYTHKYKDGLLILTSLKSLDTPIVIDGKNDSLNVYFSSYSDSNLRAWEFPNISVLMKKANLDSFYVKKGQRVLGFRIVK